MMIAVDEYEEGEGNQPGNDNGPTQDWRARTASAVLRRRRLLEAREAARVSKNRQDRKRTIPERLKAVGSALQKINIGRWIRELEQQQELADELDRINERNREEEARLEQGRQMQVAKYKEAMGEHLASFLEEFPRGSYEDWIREVDSHGDDDGQTDELLSDSDRLFLWETIHSEQIKKTHYVEDDLSDESLGGDG